MSPDISYVLGVSRLGKEEPSISVESRSDEVVERFTRIALQILGIRPEKMLVSEDDGLKRILFYDSRAKRLLSDALADRERIFKYRNEYSGSYFAGLFDARGGIDKRGLFLMHIDMKDVMVLVRLNFRVAGRGTFRIRNSGEFLEFIKPYSATLPG